jgi:hypothetical protein
MTAEEMKTIADDANEKELETFEADWKQVRNEILESAKSGSYELYYYFKPDQKQCVVYEIRNELVAAGFEVEFSVAKKENDKVYLLTIQWSKDY